jgi:hypothetical protein
VIYGICDENYIVCFILELGLFGVDGVIGVGGVGGFTV